MEQKKVYLEQLFEDIRSLSESYEVDETESDVFLLNPNEINAFSEDILRIVKKFIKSDVSVEEGLEDEEIEDATEEDEDFLFMDFYDEDDLD